MSTSDAERWKLEQVKKAEALLAKAEKRAEKAAAEVEAARQKLALVRADCEPPGEAPAAAPSKADGDAPALFAPPSFPRPGLDPKEVPAWLDEQEARMFVAARHPGIRCVFNLAYKDGGDEHADDWKAAHNSIPILLARIARARRDAHRASSGGSGA